MHSTVHPVSVINPLKALWRWLMAAPGQDQLTPGGLTTKPAPAAPSMPYAAQDLHHRLRQAAPAPMRRANVYRPLRMVRVMEAGQNASQVGRMVISGRMADVCAELDRLAAFEAPLH